MKFLKKIIDTEMKLKWQRSIPWEYTLDKVLARGFPAPLRTLDSDVVGVIKQ